MTARPNLGLRPPPRSLSANLQRPSATPSSPSRRSNDTFADVTFDSPDAVLPRQTTTLSKAAGSRLKLELETSSDPPATLAAEASKPARELLPVWRPPRGRPQLHFDVRQPVAQDGDSAVAAIHPVPLPERPVRHPRPIRETPRGEPGNAQKKDARPKPYILEAPAAAARYSPNGMLLSPRSLTAG